MSINNKAKLAVRRQQILNALLVSPYDSRQLCAMSEAFTVLFEDESYVRKAMNRMIAKGQVIGFEYPNGRAYWKLSKDGYRAVVGPDKVYPKASFFKPISPSLEKHTRRLADLDVALRIAAHRQGYEIVDVSGDHQVQLVVGERIKIPDRFYKLKQKYNGRNRYYSLLFELDCGTEWGYSAQGEDSIQREIQFYLDHYQTVDEKYRVIKLYNQPSLRLPNYVERVGQLNRNPDQQPIKAGLLQDVLANPEFLELPILRDPINDSVSMIRRPKPAPIENPQRMMDVALAS